MATHVQKEGDIIPKTMNRPLESEPIGWGQIPKKLSLVNLGGFDKRKLGELCVLLFCPSDSNEQNAHKIPV